MQPELSDFNSKRVERTQSGSKEHSRRSYILESIGSGRNDISGGKAGGDLLSNGSYSIGNNDDTPHSETTDQPAECTPLDVSDWPWG